MADALTFVVEGASDAAILRNLLPEAFSNARFFAANGRTSVSTLARNLLVHESSSVMVVADSDTSNPEKIQDVRSLIAAALRQVTSENRFTVFLFVPTIEAIFLETDETLPGLNLTRSSAELVRSVPKLALQTSLNGTSINMWQQQLQPVDWEKIRNGRQAKAFVNAALELSCASAASV